MSYKPKTMKELEDEFNAIRIPQQITRFCINENKKEPKWFGIYQDDNGNFIVYKNKADGSRFVRYKGKNEEEAVGIYYDKFVKEVNFRRKKSNRKEIESTKDMARPGEKDEEPIIEELEKKVDPHTFRILDNTISFIFDIVERHYIVKAILFIIVFGGFLIINTDIGEKRTYYRNPDTYEVYYEQAQEEWFWCNEYTNSWEKIKIREVPENVIEVSGMPANDCGDFSGSKYYRSPNRHNNNDDDDDDSWWSSSDDDWDSDWSDWDSNDTDWDSDW